MHLENMKSYKTVDGQGPLNHLGIVQTCQDSWDWDIFTLPTGSLWMKYSSIHQHYHALATLPGMNAEASALWTGQGEVSAVKIGRSGSFTAAQF